MIFNFTNLFTKSKKKNFNFLLYLNKIFLYKIILIKRYKLYKSFYILILLNTSKVIANQ